MKYDPVNTGAGIGEMDATVSGNLILRIGRNVEGEDGWQQTEYVVLGTDAALRLARDITLRIGMPYARNPLSDERNLT